MKKELKKSTKILISCVMIAIGLITIAVGGFLFKSYSKKREEYKDVKGVVVSYIIEYNNTEYYQYSEDDEYYVGNSKEVRYKPVIEYEVNGQFYEHIPNSSSSEKLYYIGQIISLKYNPKNPEESILKFDFTYGFVFIIGGVFTVAGLYAMVMSFKKPKLDY